MLRNGNIQYPKGSPSNPDTERCIILRSGHIFKNLSKTLTFRKEFKLAFKLELDWKDGDPEFCRQKWYIFYVAFTEHSMTTRVFVPTYEVFKKICGRRGFICTNAEDNPEALLPARFGSSLHDWSSAIYQLFVGLIKQGSIKNTLVNQCKNDGYAFIMHMMRLMHPSLQQHPELWCPSSPTQKKATKLFKFILKIMYGVGTCKLS